MGDNGQNMLYIEIRNAIESVEVIVNIGTRGRFRTERLRFRLEPELTKFRFHSSELTENRSIFSNSDILTKTLDIFCSSEQGHKN